MTYFKRENYKKKLYVPQKIEERIYAFMKWCWGFCMYKEQAMNEEWKKK